MSSLPRTFLTPEQYLDQERRAPFKSEYYFGEVFAMAGATRAHDRIVTNLTVNLNNQVRGRPCETYSSDMRVQTSLRGLYSYPDLSVVCGEPQFRDHHEDTLLNPIVIVEVLSPSTEAFDRGKKFAQYWRVESLKHYLLISQDRMRIEHYVRQPDNRWLLSDATEPDDEVEIDAINCKLRLAGVYDKVPLEEEPDQGDEPLRRN